MNILLITIDCWRNNCWEHTPFLRSLWKDGSATYFSNYYTTCSFTTPSICSIMTGLYPFNHGIRYLHKDRKENINPEIPTLPKTLNSYGCNTLAVTGIAPLHHGLGLGFQKHIDIKKRVNFFDSDVLNETVIQNKPKSPWFIWLHNGDAHEPYREERRGGYYQCLRKIDASIETLMQQLSPDTYVILPDHGQLFEGEHGFHFGEKAKHGDTLLQEEIHVPLIIGGKINQVDTHQVGTLTSGVDIFPTILDLTKIKKYSFDGMSLLVGHHHYVYSETTHPKSHFNKKPLKSIVSNEYKLITSWDEKESAFFYVKAEECGAIYPPKHVVEEHWNALHAMENNKVNLVPTTSKYTEQEKGQIEKQLRDLGYIE